MTATTLQTVLGSDNLTGLTRDVIGNIPGHLIPSGFLASTESVSGNTAKYDKVSTTRQAALAVQYGASSVKRNMQGVSEHPVRLIHTFQHQIHQASTLVNLREEGNAGQQMKGQQTVARQVNDFANQFGNLRKAALYSLLSKGAIYIKADGSLLASSTDAAYTVDYAVPAGNKTTCNVLGDGGILNADWSTAATDIGLQITNLKTAALKKTGYPLRHAFYGSSIPSYIYGNTMAKANIAGSPRLSEQAWTGELPNGLFGLEWHPVNEAFFELADGTATDWFAGAQITFTPDPSPEWLDTIEGSFTVPSELNISNDASSALGSALSEVFGQFGFAEIITDPPGIKQYGGDTFLPVLKVPNAIMTATVPTS